MFFLFVFFGRTTKYEKVEGEDVKTTPVVKTVRSMVNMSCHMDNEATMDYRFCIE